MQKIFNDLAMQHRDSIQSMQKRGDRDGLMALQDSLIRQTEEIAAKQPAPEISEEMRQAYANVGGAPHLDGDYTVFGEVISGMDVVDAIEKAETDGADRPTKDIRIISMKVLSE